jgi:sulfur relay protein TusB/DsrH
MKVLHVVRNNDDALARRLTETIARLDGVEQALLFIQDGVYSKSTMNLPAFACAEDVRARGLETNLELVDYDRIVEMIFDFDRVITW